MNLNWKKQGDIHTLESFDKKFLAAFSNRNFFPGFKADLEYMRKERARILESLGLELKDLVCPQQIHEASAFRVHESDKGKGAFEHDQTLQGTDILLTNEPGVILSIFTADCLSLFLYDAMTESIALSHIGWRGLAKGAVEASIDKMAQEFSSESENMLAALGPAIRGCCYQVDEPVTGYFSKFIINRDAENYLDIPEVVKTQLTEQGVLEENIIDCSICTSCSNDDFFSFRKENLEADRIISIMTLR